MAHLGIMNSFVEIGQMLEYAPFYDQFHFHVDQCLHCLLSRAQIASKRNEFKLSYVAI